MSEEMTVEQAIANMEAAAALAKRRGVNCSLTPAQTHVLAVGFQDLVAELKAKDERIAALTARAEAAEADWQAVESRLDAVQRRYTWAANELLACDYGDNEHGDVVGWHVYGWRYRQDRKDRRIYGASIDAAIDAELGAAPAVEGRFTCLDCDAPIPEHGYCEACIEKMRELIDDTVVEKQLPDISGRREIFGIQDIGNPHVDIYSCGCRYPNDGGHDRVYSVPCPKCYTATASEVTFPSK